MDYKQLFYETRDYAIKAHGGQKYGLYPYEIHLGNVVSVLVRYDIRPVNQYHYELLASAWLHDVLEDTEITKEELSAGFGDKIAAIVYALSDDKGGSRAERKANFYTKIYGNEDAMIVKLADRIANVEFCLVHHNEEKYQVYEVEQVKLNEVFSAAIQSELGIELLAYLNNLFTW